MIERGGELTVEEFMRRGDDGEVLQNNPVKDRSKMVTVLNN